MHVGFLFDVGVRALLFLLSFLIFSRIFTVLSGMTLIYAGGHCHAPSCISLELYRNDTGEILCRQLPVYGTGNVAADKYDEAGYVALPPCLWGDEDSLVTPFELPYGTPLLSIKKNRNTHVGHFGEMASWQMRGLC